MRRALTTLGMANPGQRSWMKPGSQNEKSGPSSSVPFIHSADFHTLLSQSFRSSPEMTDGLLFCVDHCVVSPSTGGRHLPTKYISRHLQPEPEPEAEAFQLPPTRPESPELDCHFLAAANYGKMGSCSWHRPRKPMVLAESHFCQAVVKALWIIGNFIRNQLKGTASARTLFCQKGKGRSAASTGKGHR